ncbi:MAG: hypothetical protein ACREB3_18025, partial [Burkholderiales bacterium]
TRALTPFTATDVPSLVNWREIVRDLILPPQLEQGFIRWGFILHALCDVDRSNAVAWEYRQ